MSNRFINGPAELVGHGQIMGSGGTVYNVYLDPNEIEAFNANPDAYAARHCGLSLEEYREWIRLNGAVLCGCQTRAGRPCRSAVCVTNDPREWRERHRAEACWVHAEGARS
jgi:hypothetical protein